MRGRWVTPFAMLDDLGGTFQTTYFADTRNVLAIPLHAEFEILVGIQTLRIDWKLSHYGFSLSSDLARHLLNLDYDEFGGIKRRKADQNVYDPLIDTGLRIVLPVALYKIGLLGRGTLKGPLEEQA